MTDTDEETRDALLRALDGKGAHVAARSALEGLGWQLAGRRPEGAPQSVLRVVNHLVYWQDYALAWLGGGKPATPEHDADSWPGKQVPTSEAEWQGAVTRFGAGLDRLCRHAREDDLDQRCGPKTARFILQTVASHNSYHLGQVVLLRQMLDAWPPPGGGFTW